MNTSKSAYQLISVVIPAYNSESTIEKTLNALLNQQGDFEYEIIVVDSSNDSTPDIIRSKFPGVKLIQLENKTPAGLARNLGAETATGEFIAFLDSDCVVENNWLDSLAKNFSDDYWAVGGPIENANPEDLIGQAGYILEFSDFFPRGSRRAVDHIPAGNIFLRKDTFEKSGGFSAQYNFAQEDRFLSWRLGQKTGKMLLFDPDIKVKHYHRVTGRDYLAHQMTIGRGGAEILKSTNIRGSALVRKRWLTNLLLPAIPLPKLGRCIYRTLKWKPGEFAKRPQLIPLLCLGMFFWMVGFAQGVNAK